MGRIRLSDFMKIGDWHFYAGSDGNKNYFICGRTLKIVTNGASETYSGHLDTLLKIVELSEDLHEAIREWAWLGNGIYPAIRDNNRPAVYKDEGRREAVPG